MPDDVVRATAQGVRILADGVAQFTRSIEEAEHSARSALTAVQADVQTACAKTQQIWQAALRRAESADAAVRACREDCEPLIAAAARARSDAIAARRAHDQNLRQAALFETVSAAFSSALTTAQNVLGQHGPVARQAALEYATELQAYLATNATGN